MTRFEELMKEIGISPTTSNRGLYTGKAEALGVIANEIILSEDEAIFNLNWDEQKKLIKEKFYRTFPYMNAE